MPTLPLISLVGSLSNTKKVFLGLSIWDDELLSTPKITTFLAVSTTFASKAIPQSL